VFPDKWVTHAILFCLQVEWTRQLVAQQQQKTERITKETEKMKAILDAEREKEVDEIEISKDIQKEEGRRNATKIRSKVIRFFCVAILAFVLSQTALLQIMPKPSSARHSNINGECHFQPSSHIIQQLLYLQHCSFFKE
jgi:hypothetical protein